MLTITALNLRQKLEEVIDLVASGEDVELTFRGGKKRILLTQISNSNYKTQLSGGQKIVDFLNSPEYLKFSKSKSKASPISKDWEKVKDAHQEKANIRNLMSKRYE